MIPKVDCCIDAINHGVKNVVIMDGRILEGNLKRRGLDLTWLQKEIKRQKYNNAKEIFFAFCDSDNKLYIYPVKV